MIYIWKIAWIHIFFFELKKTNINIYLKFKYVSKNVHFYWLF